MWGRSLKEKTSFYNLTAKAQLGEWGPHMLFPDLLDFSFHLFQLCMHPGKISPAHTVGAINISFNGLDQNPFLLVCSYT